jgi:hypothetical protein
MSGVLAIGTSFAVDVQQINPGMRIDRVESLRESISRELERLSLWKHRQPTQLVLVLRLARLLTPLLALLVPRRLARRRPLLRHPHQDPPLVQLHMEYPRMTVI